MRICAFCSHLHDEAITLRVTDEGPRPMYFCSWQHLTAYGQIRARRETFPLSTEGKPP